MRFFLLWCCTLLAWSADPGLQLDVISGRVDKRDLHLDLCLPGTGPGPFPLILWIHGGGWHAGSHHEFDDQLKGFAGLGFAGASLEYRLAPEARWPGPLDDLRQSLDFLISSARSNRLDLRRVVLVGGSAGGHLALRLGFDPRWPKAMTLRGIVNFAGPTQLGLFASNPLGDAYLKASSGMDAQQLVADLLGSGDRSSAIYAEASPLTWVRPGLPPVLTIHGTDDPLVPLSQAEALHAALKHAKVEETLIRGAGGGHVMGEWSPPEKDRGTKALMGFLSQHLVP
jgi:acetyl esterase/lipase